MIRNIFIIRDGIGLVKLNFGQCHSLGTNEDLIVGFISGLEIFSDKVMGSQMKNIKVQEYIIHFYKDPSDNLLYVFISEHKDKIDEIRFKMQKISSLFSERYKEVLLNFDGEVSRFNDFGDLLIEMNLAQKNCGGRPECDGCPNSGKSLKFLRLFQKEKKGFFNRLKSLFKKQN